MVRCNAVHRYLSFELVGSKVSLVKMIGLPSSLLLFPRETRKRQSVVVPPTAAAVIERKITEKDGVGVTLSRTKNFPEFANVPDPCNECHFAPHLILKSQAPDISSRC